MTGLAREDFIFDNTDDPIIAPLSYPAADLDPAKAKISVRAARSRSARHARRSSFAFEGPDKISIQRPNGFDAGAIYEFIYTAKDPKVMGLGFAATRDIVSFLRHEAADAPGRQSPRRPHRPRHRFRRRRKAAAICTISSISASMPTKPAARCSKG